MNKAEELNYMHGIIDDLGNGTVLQEREKMLVDPIGSDSLPWTRLVPYNGFAPNFQDMEYRREPVRAQGWINIEPGMGQHFFSTKRRAIKGASKECTRVAVYVCEPKEEG